MGEFKGTQGPWRMEGTRRINDEAGNMICGLVDAEDQGEGIIPATTANAKLIAAAPELYEALKYVRRFVSKEKVDTEYIDRVLTKAVML